MMFLQSMNTLNQSKNKQIKTNRGLPNAATKKTLSKEPSRFKITSNGKSSKLGKSQAKLHLPTHLQNQIDLKNNKKKYSNEVQEEYFNRKKRHSNNAAQNGPTYDHLSFKSSGRQTSRKYTITDCQEQQALSKTTKLKLLQPKGVITFEGKFIKLEVPEKKSTGKHYNFTTLSNSDYTSLEKDFTSYCSPKKIKLSRLSKSKSKGKNKMKKKSLPKPKPKHKQAVDHQQCKLNFMSEQTQLSPISIQYARFETFNFCQIEFLIDRELKAINQIQIDASVFEIRKGCLKMLSNICGSLKIRKETFFLSVEILDRYLSCKSRLRDQKLAGIVSLSLALKLEETQLAVQFVYMLGFINSSKSGAVSSPERVHQSKSRSKMKKKQYICHESAKQLHLQDKAKKLHEILLEQSCGPICKADFIEMEQSIALKLQFRFNLQRIIYWTDMLTCLWDHFILIEYRQSQQLLFRCPKSSTNIGCLYQIIELCYINRNVYQYPKTFLVLSIMYLLIRITMEKRQAGFEFYRKQLGKSSNILFVDRIGVNQLFWAFLKNLKVEMGDILNCCQYVSQFLDSAIIKQKVLQDFDCDNYDHGICLHQHYPDLYTSLQF